MYRSRILRIQIFLFSAIMDNRRRDSNPGKRNFERIFVSRKIARYLRLLLLITGGIKGGGEHSMLGKSAISPPGRGKIIVLWPRAGNRRRSSSSPSSFDCSLSSDRKRVRHVQPPSLTLLLHSPLRLTLLPSLNRVKSKRNAPFFLSTYFFT